MSIPTLTVGGIPTANTTRAELAEQMATDCRDARNGTLAFPKIVFASNGSVIAAFHRGGVFSEAFRQADTVDADGMPLVLATKLLCKEPLKERIATTDFIHDAAKVALREKLNFFFLGAKPGVAEKAAGNLRSMYPGLSIVGTRNGFFDRSDTPSICADIRSKNTDVLWLGLGSPLQEIFAVENRKSLQGVGWIRTCGGLFDHYDGVSKRAPAWMQAVGLEWFFRALREPVRLGTRYLLTNPVAAYHLATKTRD